MIEILQFIFRGFWTFLGTLLLVGAIGNVFSSIFGKTPIINNYNVNKESDLDE